MILIKFYILQHCRFIKIGIHFNVIYLFAIYIIVGKAAFLAKKCIITWQSRTTDAYPTCRTQSAHHAKLRTVARNAFVKRIILFAKEIIVFQQSDV